MLLTAIALVLVLSRHCKQCVDSLLALCVRLGRKFRGHEFKGIAFRTPFPGKPTSRLAAPPSSFYSVPLQI